jgi:hypothetical protein
VKNKTKENSSKGYVKIKQFQSLRENKTKENSSKVYAKRKQKKTVPKFT